MKTLLTAQISLRLHGWHRMLAVGSCHFLPYPPLALSPTSTAMVTAYATAYAKPTAYATG